MARDATARLYDVDEDAVIFKKLQITEKYDQGTITFAARNGKRIDLDKLHESIWATRLSGGTGSGLVSLDVTAIGRVVETDDRTILKVKGSDAEFVLLRQQDEKLATQFDELKKVAGGGGTISITGRIDNYSGRWPNVLGTAPSKPRRILVTGFAALDGE